MPLPRELRSLLQTLRDLPEDQRTPQQQRQLEDLEHRDGVSSAQDAIEAGSPQEAAPRANLVHCCPVCGSKGYQTRRTPTGVRRHCLDCGNKWGAACGPTVVGARVPAPTANPSVVITPDSYYPSGGRSYRHPLKNFGTEES